MKNYIYCIITGMHVSYYSCKQKTINNWVYTCHIYTSSSPYWDNQYQVTCEEISCKKGKAFNIAIPSKKNILQLSGKGRLQPLNMLLSTHPGCMWQQHLGSPNEVGHTSVLGGYLCAAEKGFATSCGRFFQRHNDFGRSAHGPKHLGNLAIVPSFESLLFQICPPI